MVKSGLAILLLGAFYCSHGATLYVSQDGAHILPFNDWSAAATNIQAAIDAATAGDTVLVTNGTYSSGGRAVSGSVTNRVAIYKPIEVRSVNGAALTTIEGMWDGAMNGPSAVRCVWITNGAALRGFTLTKGATRSSNNSSGSDFSGGAVYGSTNGGLGLIDQCSVVSNAASYAGGGVFQANVSRCLIAQNQAVGFACAGMGPSGQGGGAYGSQLANCTIVSNVANFSGGGAELCSVKNSAILANLTGVQGGGICESVALNCTIVGNRAGDGYTNLTCHYPGYGGGENASSLTNCILFQNSAYGGPDYYLGNLAYCCATPLPGGPGNIAADPLLLADWLHLSSSSPCQGVGRPGAGSGTDIDGQLWAAIPSIGCDEWHEEPIAINRPRVVLTAGVRSLKIVADQFAGQEPFGLVWQKDGFPLSDDSHYYGANSRTLVITNLEPSDSGDYGLSASNAYGLAVTAFHTTLHFVSPAAPNPIPPFTNWTSAAMRIQDALESAFQDDVIVVTNGVYDTGGKVGSSDATTNRLVVGRGIGLMSVNGNSVTTIQGAWDVSSTNGNSAIRCVWLGDRSQMAGFTLSGGATVTSGKGGAVYCESFNSLVADCILTNNSALQGGGCYQGSLYRSTLINNRAVISGGGAYESTLTNCLVSGNFAGGSAGALQRPGLVNCTVVGNAATPGASAVSSPRFALNSIIYYNKPANWSGSGIVFSNCCTTPAPSDSSNITAEPQLLDRVHLAITSPCGAAGNAAFLSGADIDGEAWNSPPSIGCDELIESSLNGPLCVTAWAAWPSVAAGGMLPLSGSVSGKATRVAWDYGDGTQLTNLSLTNVNHTWTNAGDYVVEFTAFNNDSPGGVATNFTVHVVPLTIPLLSAAPKSGTNFNLNFAGQAGITYFVQMATNLGVSSNWATIGTLSSTGSTMLFNDTRATNNSRFYRLLIQR